MDKIYNQIERGFEKIASAAMTLLGNSITFIVALLMVIIWLSDIVRYKTDLHNAIGDIILGFTFLTLFIIQKSFNRFSASLHLKVNELVASHEPASNTVINLEEKTEREINDLSKEYDELTISVKQISNEKPPKKRRWYEKLNLFHSKEKL
jgi:low affinity Fe/Cu permease